VRKRRDEVASRKNEHPIGREKDHRQATAKINISDVTLRF